MMSVRCWLVGGTSDSAAIAQQLSDLAIPYVVTVTTASARGLYPKGALVEVGKLSRSLAQDFVQRHRVNCIADASHPFASEISRCAIALASDCQIPYLRYERPVVETQPISSQETSSDLGVWNSNMSNSTVDSEEAVTLVNSIDDLVDNPLLRSQLKSQRILFTIGYRHLEKFASLRATSKLYARILPSAEAIASTRSAGFESSEIIALKPPISLALEKALWQQWNISCVVAKCSGRLANSVSGEQVKRQAARALGVRLIMIARPAIAYPCKTENLTDVVSFCRKYTACARIEPEMSL